MTDNNKDSTNNESHDSAANTKEDSAGPHKAEIKSFGDEDFNKFVTTREYLQAKSADDTERTKIHTKEIIIVAIMYVLMVIGLFGMLFYIRHIQDVTNAAVFSVSAERDIRDTRAETNLTQLCNYTHKLVKSHQDTLDILISDPAFQNDTTSTFKVRLQKIKAIQASIDKQLLPTCETFTAIPVRK